MWELLFFIYHYAFEFQIATHDWKTSTGKKERSMLVLDLDNWAFNKLASESPLPAKCKIDNIRVRIKYMSTVYKGRADESNIQKASSTWGSKDGLYFDGWSFSTTVTNFIRLLLSDPFGESMKACRNILLAKGMTEATIRKYTREASEKIQNPSRSNLEEEEMKSSEDSAPPKAASPAADLEDEAENAMMAKAADQLLGKDQQAVTPKQTGTKPKPVAVKRKRQDVKRSRQSGSADSDQPREEPEPEEDAGKSSEGEDYEATAQEEDKLLERAKAHLARIEARAELARIEALVRESELSTDTPRIPKQGTSKKQAKKDLLPKLNIEAAQKEAQKELAAQKDLAEEEELEVAASQEGVISLSGKSDSEQSDQEESDGGQSSQEPPKKKKKAKAGNEKKPAKKKRAIEDTDESDAANSGGEEDLFAFAQSPPNIR